MQCLMLAAGMGKRLGKYTKDNTKCMLQVDGKTLLERTIDALKYSGINRLIMVVGYQRENVKKYVKEKINDMEVIFVDNVDYDKSNNIYSLFLARNYLTEDDTILLESDLIYDKEILKKIVEHKEKNIVAIAKYEQWMDGTVVTIDSDNNILDFVEKKDFVYGNIDKYYKTVNIYKFSKEFSEKQYVPFVEAYIKAYGLNEYYEIVLKAIAHLSRSNLKGIDVSNYNWYEIDDAQDLDIVNCIFTSGKEKLKNFQKRYGGYWRFSNIKDYCYLVNPYFPNKSVFEKIDYFSNKLLVEYPSSLSIQNLNASRLFDVNDEYLIVGNGAAELINVLGNITKGKIAISMPAFNEYKRCFEKNCTFNIINSKENDYKFDLDKIHKIIDISDEIIIINPDNPSGSFIEYNDIIKIIEECYNKEKIIVIDESFIDFADKDKKYTLIKNDILDKYENLIVIKSISKSYGIPGVRLGILATSNKEILGSMKINMPVWNINSYAEYFLQIGRLFKTDYEDACEKISLERNKFISKLRKLDGIKVYDSQANYVLCKILNKKSTDIAVSLLENNDIFIKDLNGKIGFENEEYIRLAIKTEKENNELINALKELL